MALRAPIVALLVALVGCDGAERPPPSAPAPAPADAPAPDEPAPPGPAAAGPACPPDLRAVDDPGQGWPTDADALVAHLNRWDRDELEAVARPDLEPDRVASGETNGWVSAHQDQLRALGVEIAWNAEHRCYGVVRDVE